MSAYEIRTTAMVVVPQGEPLFSEMATTVSIIDEAAGEFVEVSQDSRANYGKIGINPEEWPMLRKVIDMAIGYCRPSEAPHTSAVPPDTIAE